MQYVEVVVVGLPVCSSRSVASGRSGSSLEAVVESRQGVAVLAVVADVAVVSGVSGSSCCSSSGSRRRGSRVRCVGG